MAGDASSDSRAVPREQRAIARPRKLKWRHYLAAGAIVAGFRLLSCTWRMRFVDPHGVLVNPRTPVIYCCWHNRLAVSIKTWERVQRSSMGFGGLVALISASHDGGVLALVLKHFGVEAVRGSSSRRGAQALLELTTWTERQYNVAITPDGPRGPCYRVSEGAIALAQLSGYAIVPVSTKIPWKIRTRSWDRFQVPLPFARCEVRLGEPLCVARDLDDEGRARIAAELKARLDHLTED